ncbi:hypothetical protein GGR56DRAFT_242743 [Xylariaceae sp. FL0804]|nr:hypothetical protein GGR56DRAFT_242743 [Xylariaceae sp. FL0804]
MRRHTERWRCAAKSHGEQTFQTRRDFNKHMTETHGKTYTTAQLELLGDRLMLRASALFACCPLCGGEQGGHDDKVPGKLIEHIVGHLRSLALKSLPPYYENGDGEVNSNIQGFQHSIPKYPCEHCEAHQGQHGFKRKDHLTQHLRVFHHLDNAGIAKYLSDRHGRPNRSRPGPDFDDDIDHIGSWSSLPQVSNNAADLHLSD